MNGQWPARNTPLFVTAPLGTETALKAELRDLGLGGAKADRGGVRVRGGVAAVTRLCTRSRVAVRVMVEVGRFAAPDERALYQGIGAIEWSRWLTPELTLGIRAASKRSRLTHTAYLAQKTKDAIVDGQRRVDGRRSSVDKRDPDVSIFVRLDRDEASVFLDASGQSLHRRGWRTEQGEAPLKENLAAAILRLSGWDRERPLHDPLCGSGTFPIEADLWARGIPAHPDDRTFGFERWADASDTRAAAIAERANGRARIRDSGPLCSGSDQAADMIEIARSNAERAASLATFEVGAIADVVPPKGAHILANPPYGARLDADEMDRELAAAVARWRAHPITFLLPEDHPLATERVRGRKVRVAKLFNGALRCVLVTLEPG